MPTFRPSARGSVLDQVRAAAGIMPNAQPSMGNFNNGAGAPVSAPEAAIPLAMASTPTSAPVAQGQPSSYGWNEQTSYAKGGMVGPGGAAIRPGMALGAQPQQRPDSPEMASSQIDSTVSRADPQVVEQVRQAIQQAIQSGEMTLADLQTAGRLAKIVLHDPSMYPQIRQFAIQHGMVDPEDLPEQYDQGLVYALLLAAQSMVGAQPQGQGQPNQGAPVTGSTPGAPPTNSTPGQPTNIQVHGGEYIVPAHVVGMKGKEFFDKLVGQYDPNQQGPVGGKPA